MKTDWTECAIFALYTTIHLQTMGITDIYEAISRNAESFFEWAQTHPQFAMLFVAALLALWLVGLLLRWKWACHWQFGSKLWMFDDCKPETRRLVQIFLVGAALIASLVLFFLWR